VVKLGSTPNCKTKKEKKHARKRGTIVWMLLSS
jgi:hypothetical protein